MMTGFELRTSSIGSNHSTNWAITTALHNQNLTGLSIDVF